MPWTDRLCGDGLTITHQRWRAVVAIVLALGASASGCRSDVTSFETCDVCQSTRELSSSGERLLHRGKNVDHGPHMWTTGLKLAEATPIDVGAVVLLRRVPAGATAPVFGAVVITQQEMSPQRVSYRWYWRPDGKAMLDPADPAVQQGEERGQNRIKFGPFDVHWSGSGDRGGFMYYERFSHMPIGANTTFVCKTEIRSLSGLDASSSRWLFKSSVVD